MRDPVGGGSFLQTILLPSFSAVAAWAGFSEGGVGGCGGEVTGDGGEGVAIG
jgi:hypothetical protein